MSKENQVWLVTGASKGLGLVLVKNLLAKGYRVAATSRNAEQLTKAVGVTDTALFLPLETDMTSDASVSESVQKAHVHFGRLDALVNNAGYGQIGAVEELTEEEVSKNFEVNVFGTIRTIRNSMAYMRQNGSGHIFNISSVGGFSANFAGWGIYCATKFAVSAISEALSAEAKEFGIQVTNVYPGYFRTGFLSNESIGLPEKPIAAYSETRKSQEIHTKEINNNQTGDPEKAADVLISVFEYNQPPLHLFLGPDAYETAKLKMQKINDDMDQWQTVAAATNFD